MPSMSLMASIFCFLVVSLLGCDTGDPDPPEEADPLIGSWRLTEARIPAVLTAHSDQEAVDQSSEGEGEIAVSGEVSAELSYLSIQRIEGGYLLRAAGDAHYAEEPYLEVRDQEGQVQIDLYADGSVYSGTDPVGYSLDGFTLELSDVELTSGSESVTVNGALTAASVQVPAETPTPVGSYLHVAGDGTEIVVRPLPVDQYEVTVEFESDGTFTQTIVFQGQEQTITGTWNIEEDSLALSGFMPDGDTGTQRFAYQIQSNMLSLSARENACEVVFEEEISRDECLQRFEDSYLLERGSLSAVGQGVSLSFSRIE